MGNKIGNHLNDLTPEGKHLSTIGFIKLTEGVPTRMGTQKRSVVGFRFPDGYMHFQSYHATTYINTPMGKLIRTLLGEIDEDNFELDDLKGIECEITIKHHIGADGKKYANVVEVEPIPPISEEEKQKNIDAAEKLLSDEEEAS